MLWGCLSGYDDGHKDGDGDNDRDPVVGDGVIGPRNVWSFARLFRPAGVVLSVLKEDSIVGREDPAWDDDYILASCRYIDLSLELTNHLSISLCP